LLDLDYLRKRLPKQLAQMSDEQLEVYRGELYALANLAVDSVVMTDRDSADHRAEGKPER
jgi:hypothetical protein